MADENYFDDILLEHLDLFIAYHEITKEPITLDIDGMFPKTPENKKEEFEISAIKMQLKNELFFRNHCIFTELFEYLFFHVFKMFNDTWVDQHPGIMEFTQFLQSVF